MWTLVEELPQAWTLRPGVERVFAPLRPLPPRESFSGQWPCRSRLGPSPPSASPCPRTACTTPPALQQGATCSLPCASWRPLACTLFSPRAAIAASNFLTSPTASETATSGVRLGLNSWGTDLAETTCGGVGLECADGPLNLDGEQLATSLMVASDP